MFFSKNKKFYYLLFTQWIWLRLLTIDDHRRQSMFAFFNYTTVSWDSSSGWKSDPNAFLFFLTNKDNQPLKMNVDPNRHDEAIYCDSDVGPTFGNDIIIHTHANTTMDSYSILSINYSYYGSYLFTSQICIRNK
jgi:hypothetical protein